MPRHFKKTAAACALALTLGVSQPAHAYGCPMYDDTTVTNYIAAIEVALKGLLQYIITAAAKMMFSYDKNELASMKVVTAQIATGARAQINAKAQLAKAKVSALGYLTASEEHLRTFQDFSPKTGQGVDPCKQINAQQLVVVADAISRSQASAWARSTYSAPGRFGDPGAYNQTLVGLRMQKYATKDDEALGFGKANTDEVTTATGEKFPLAGADTNARTLFADTDDARVKEAKQTYLANVAGPPELGVPNLNGQTNRQYYVSKGRKDAVMSAAVHSMAVVAAENTPSKDSGGKSKSQALRDVVDQYYGKEGVERWKSWMGQSERGLMLDSMKMDAAMLAARRDLYKSGSRLELSLGLLVLMESDKFAAGMDGQLNDITDANNIRAGAR